MREKDNGIDIQIKYGDDAKPKSKGNSGKGIADESYDNGSANKEETRKSTLRSKKEKEKRDRRIKSN